MSAARKAFRSAGEDFDAAGVDGLEALFATQDVRGGAALCAGFGEDQRAVGKIEGGEGVAAGELWLAAARQCRRPAIIR